MASELIPVLFEYSSQLKDITLLKAFKVRQFNQKVACS